MKILIVGGAGYIGSHMSKLLVKSGHEVIVLDNLSTGFRKNVKYGELVVGDLADIGLLENVFSTYQFDAVMHFAANSLAVSYTHLDMLIGAFSKLNSKDIHLSIIGEGQQRVELEQKIEELGVSEQVDLLGQQMNPFAILKQANIYVLSS
ncbi:hypothetical protein Tanf_12575, partial [Tannerella forsythia]